MSLTWKDPREIGMALADAHPAMTTQQVMYVRFTDLHAMVCALEEFDDDPKDSTEADLEAIQAAWLEEIED